MKKGVWLVVFTFCMGAVIKKHRESAENKKVKKKTDAETEAQERTHLDTLAYDVLHGKYGYGEARKKALGSLYPDVQTRVNQIVKDNVSNDLKFAKSRGLSSWVRFLEDYLREREV